MLVNVGTKLFTCSFVKLVGTGSKTQLWVADFLTICSTYLPNNMLISVNLCSVNAHLCEKLKLYETP